ncbi:TIGR03009 domain-containing protein [Aureliella helgolandensis]|uniref:TIGR03009 domain-containing protein n=1 Tax=Aureliella helgolandensis TaxID=2527968 RepID=A0A518GC48_9BACT|nr:TIGR03009 domain-containing protein [Aureliella helgolandensis]QDV26178.1 hypothetical protein Q31a_45500 [Aureliella helgolandensis]
MIRNTIRFTVWVSVVTTSVLVNPACCIAQVAAPPAGEQQQRVPLMSAEQAVQAGIAQVAQQPFPELSQQEQSFLDQVLMVWEQRTAAIKRYQCEFQRFQFDPGNLPDAHMSQATGFIKFMDPGKGEFRVDKVETVSKKTPPYEYRVDPTHPYGEHWICDGEWVHVLDHNEKKATRIQLSPESRGKEVYRSPLPFLFGVKAAEIKQRYWARPLFPAGRPENELWIEVWPKSANDAGNYSRVQVILDRNDSLPMALIVFLPNWSPSQEHREVYQFSNRKSNGVLDAIAGAFGKSFIPTKLGNDWEVVEEPYIPPQADLQAGNPASGQAPPQRSAQQPSAGQFQ